MELLARGAMSEVWVDPARPGLVYKRIRADQVTNPVFVHQQRVEATALAAVAHPGVLRLVEVDAGGLWLERGAPASRPAPADRPALLDHLADALRAVHAAGVVHRDVKASNLLWVPRGGGTLVLADFGCARVDGLPDPAPALGSPEGMSPSRLAGAPATPTDDWWALGALAWTWLTGEAPFPSRRWAEVRALHARGLPLLPPDADAAVVERLTRWMATR